jgi:hypothetical protein
MSTRLLNKSEVLKALAKIIERGAVFEVRALEAQLCGNRRTGTVSGYFDNPDTGVSELEKLTAAKGIYITANPVNRALLARRANRLDFAEKNALTGDQHIVRRRWLLIDVDPDRPSGISATDAEKAAAKKKALEIYGFLKERGWPEPVAADSGNGHHLEYLIDLPCDDGKILEKVLAVLADRFDGGGVKLDRTVFNPSRIARLYGTLAAKGDNTKERPHRLSKILKAPDMLQVVSVEKLLALVEELQPAEPPPVERPAAHGGGFDVEAFLTRYGVAVAERMTRSDGTIKWRLERCVFNPEHETPDAAVFQFPDGKLGYKCFHNCCVDKHWKDFRRLFEPDYDYGKAAHVKPGEAPQWQDPQPLPEDLPAVPPFDYQCLPETLHPWIKDIAERMQCPPDFPAVGAMIALGSVLGRKIGIRPKRHDDWVEIANLWGGIIARPGLLKTPALQQALVHLRHLKVRAFEQYEKEIRDHEISAMLIAQSKKIVEETIKKHLKDKKEAAARDEAEKHLKAANEKPVCRRYEVNDSTIPKLGELLAENPNGLLLVRDELSGFLRSLDREEHAGDRAAYLEMWDGKGELTYDRIGRGTVRVPSNTLSILGGIQPDVITSYVREAVRGGSGNDGLVQRFQLFVWPDVPGDWHNVDEWPDKEAKNQAFGVFEYLDSLTPETVGANTSEGIPFLRFTDDAQELFDAWHAELEKKLRSDIEHPAFEGHLAKYRKLVPVLALLIHLADRKTGRVSLDALNKALSWATYLEPHARRIYSAVLRPDAAAARELAKHLQRGDLRERFNLREVYHKGWAGLGTKDDAEAAAEILCDLGWIRPAVDARVRAPGTPGRAASPMFEVNPKILIPPSTPTSKTSTTDSGGSGGDHQGVSEKSEAPIEGDEKGVGRL